MWPGQVRGFLLQCALELSILLSQFQEVCWPLFKYATGGFNI